MTVQAFIDESIRGRYIVCAITLHNESVASVRGQMRGLLQGGRRRLHMTKERDGERHRVLRFISQLDIAIHLTSTFAGDFPQRRCRDGCLEEMARILGPLDTRRLVIESCDQDQADRQVIGDALASIGLLNDTEILHSSPKNEPLLWIADAVAWAYGKRGNFWTTELQKLTRTEKNTTV